MTSFLFWNLYKKRLEDQVARLVVTHQIDVLMLAECVSRPEELAASIRAKGATPSASRTARTASSW
jgi:hypothetical protein